MSNRKLFGEPGIAAIEAAIAQVEKVSSGEIRVLVVDTARDDIGDQTAREFHEQGMGKTRDSTGMLILVAMRSKRFAIYADAGLHGKVADWTAYTKGMAPFFQKGAFADGVVHLIQEVGKVLQEHYPPRENNTDELPNEVIFRD